MTEVKTRKSKYNVKVGDIYNMLTVVSQIEHYNKWNCVCECGNTCVIPSCDLVTGHDKSCGCTYERLGLRYHSAYKSWQHMKDRCLNPNNQDYEYYGGRGITVHEDFKKSFSKFLEAIGERPEGRWSIGRIDNNGHYTYGNIRWENDAQQARNHSIQTSNTSGIVGVRRNTKTIAGKEYHSWVASWSTGNKSRTKEFSCNKFGEDVAKQMAIDFRNKMIEELNKRGFDYAESHGKEKLKLNGNNKKENN